MTKIRSEHIPQTNDFRALSEIDHALVRPDTLLGNIKIQELTYWQMEQNRSISQKLVKISPALLHIFLETTTNASDNADRSRQANYPIGEIHVHIHGKTVTVENNGVPIPVEMHPEGCYVPELIFGRMRTGINFGDVKDEHGKVNQRTKIRRGAGRNGYGAKIANIFSKKFEIFIQDSIRKKEYKQVWKENMKSRGKPVVRDYTGDQNVVRLTYHLDFERFGYPEDYQYGEDDIKCMRFITCNNAMSQRIPSYFNKNPVPHLLEEFRDRFLEMNQELEFEKKEEEEEEEEPVKRKILTHIEWPIGTKFIGKGKTARPENPHLLPDLEVVVMDKVPNLKAISFSTTSGAINMNGGAHEKAVLDQIANHLSHKITNVSKPYLRSNMKSFLSFIIVYRAENPEFRGQMKDTLISPKPNFVLSEQEKKDLHNWFVIEYIMNMVNIQEQLNAKKTDGKLKRNVRVETLTDATWAGTRKSHETYLCYVEGLSAKGYPNKLRDVLGTDRLGIIHGKGVPINAMNAPIQRLNANTEYIALKQALGLREGVDYTKEDERSKLRYGSLWLMADADDDGIHITGLLLLLLHERFPTLIQSGYVKIWCSPIIRAWKGSGKRLKNLRFYSQTEFDQWIEKTPNWKTWEIKYQKGLGSSRDKHIKEDAQDPHLVTFRYDETTPDYLRLAFHNKYPDMRKEWMYNYEPHEFNFQHMESMNISEYFAYQYVRFSIADTSRSLPHRMDGLKVSQRKCIFGSFQYVKTPDSLAQKESLVESMAAFIGHTSMYHHGVASLYGTIEGMTHAFTGSNNIPIYEQRSQMGTRIDYGKDAASPRYAWLVMNPLIRNAILLKSDDPLLEYVDEEGIKCEPYSYHPCVPLLIINGNRGIGTGNQGLWPACDPLVIVQYIYKYLNKEEIPTIVPSYRGFRGEITLQEFTRTRKASPPDLQLPYSSFGRKLTDPHETYYKAIIKGCVEGTKERAVVTEIPIGMSFLDYEKFLHHLIENKAISRFENNSTSNHPEFVLYKHPSPVVENLNLIGSFSLANLVALDDLGRPHRYNTLNEYFEWWCQARYEIYVQRKEYVDRYLQEELEKLDCKIRFIRSYLDRTLTIEGRTQEQIAEDMKRMKFPADLLDTKLSQLSQTRYDALKKQRNDVHQEMTTLQKKSPGDLWRADLKHFETEYTKWLKRIESTL